MLCTKIEMAENGHIVASRTEPLRITMALRGQDDPWSIPVSVLGSERMSFVTLLGEVVELLPSVDEDSFAGAERSPCRP